MSRISAAGCLFIWSIVVGAQPSEVAQLTALSGATLIDGTGGPVVINSRIIVVEDTIVAVGSADEIDIPTGATVVNLENQWVVPGFIDLHVHFWESGRPGAQPTYVADLTDVFAYDDEIAWMKRRASYTLGRYICSGVTSVVALGAIPWEYEVRDQADSMPDSPRVFLAGGFIGNYRPTVQTSPMWDGELMGLWIETPEDASRLVASFSGVDLIKAGYIPGGGLSLNEFEPALHRLIEESHARGLPVSVHATTLDSAKMALRLGADILAHSVSDRVVDDEFVQAALNLGAVVTSTLGYRMGHARLTDEQFQLSPHERTCGDPEVISAWEEWDAVADSDRAGMGLPDSRAAELATRNMVANMSRLHDAGVKIAVGSDAGNIGSMHGPSFHTELELLSRAGLSPMEVIVAATRHGAEALQMNSELGTVEVGKYADLVVLSADPLVDVANLNRIAKTMIRGILIERADGL